MAPHHLVCHRSSHDLVLLRHGTWAPAQGCFPRKCQGKKASNKAGLSVLPWQTLKLCSPGSSWDGRSLPGVARAEVKVLEVLVPARSRAQLCKGCLAERVWWPGRQAQCSLTHGWLPCRWDSWQKVSELPCVLEQLWVMVNGMGSGGHCWLMVSFSAGQQCYSLVVERYIEARHPCTEELAVRWRDRQRICHALHFGNKGEGLV